MSIAIQFYKFSKLPNSTKRPSGTAKEYQCLLKDACSVLNPSIELYIPFTENPAQYNYCYIPAWDRYYYVSDWSYSPTTCWMANLNNDALASWRDTIGAASEYVERAASSYDLAVGDAYYPATATRTFQKISHTNIWAANDDYSKGFYVVGIINGDSNAIGGVGYYIFTPANFRLWSHALLATDDWVGEANMLKTEFNPIQYISTVLWFPLPIGAAGVSPDDALSKVDFGWWSLPCSCYRCPSSGSHVELVYEGYELPKHPQAGRGKWLNLAPYTTYTLQLYPFGVIDIPPALVINSKRLKLDIVVDLVSGCAVLSIYNDDYTLVTSAQANIGVDVQIAQITTNYKGAVASAISSPSEMLTTAWLSMAGASIETNGQTTSFPQYFNTVKNMVRASAVSITASGSTGNVSVYKLEQFLQASFLQIVSEDLEHLGRPLCKKVKISSLSGFIKTLGSDVAIPGYAAEGDLIRATMDDGFYYE